ANRPEAKTSAPGRSLLRSVWYERTKPAVSLSRKRQTIPALPPKCRLPHRLEQPCRSAKTNGYSGIPAASARGTKEHPPHLRPQCRQTCHPPPICSFLS